MPYLLLILEFTIMTFFLVWRFNKFQAFKKRMNPNGEAEDAHNLVKTGKTERIRKERVKYHNSMVLILAAGLTALSFTMFIYSSEIVNQHREDGLITLQTTPQQHLFEVGS